MQCTRFNPDNIFQRFEVIEFPICFVGLSMTKILNVGVDLNSCAYIKTKHEGRLVRFEDARNVSAPHRTFSITQIDSQSLKINFAPRNESISKIKQINDTDNRFVIDLHLIRTDGIQCCLEEEHSEIGRYYISGQYEHCKITHYPDTIEFGELFINTSTKKCIQLKNECTVLTVMIKYKKIVGFEVTPECISIPPNCSRKLYVIAKPSSMNVSNTITFYVTNPLDSNATKQKDSISLQSTDLEFQNYIIYEIPCKLRVKFPKNTKHVSVTSLHNLYEQDKKYTYVGKEIEIHNLRQKIAFDHLQDCKQSRFTKKTLEKTIIGKQRCSYEDLLSCKKVGNFCIENKRAMTTFDVFNIVITPNCIDFGRVGLMTYGEQEIYIKNNTKDDVIITLLEDERIFYTDSKLKTFNVKVKSSSLSNIKLLCLGYIEGNNTSIFEYIINEKFYRKHQYRLQVGNPTLMIEDRNLKFGMTGTEIFVTSVPVKILNNFNLPVNFNWNDLPPEIPFEITPKNGFIPKHSCRICDIMYVCRPSKSKIHEVDFISSGSTEKIIPLELNILTRKLSIKFLQSFVLFKDIPLNLERKEVVKLENSSREIAYFHIVEPLIPGLSIEPMSGIIRPKMIMTFEIIVKIPCIMEFSLDINVKINNKENVYLPITGNVVEPKLVIHPKSICMTRVPSYTITYVPVTFQNLSPAKCSIEVLGTEDDNMFDIYTTHGNEKEIVSKFDVQEGQTKTVYVKVYDVYRREYDIFLPFRINELLGPPVLNSLSTELQYYTKQYEKCYENNPRVKLKSVNKDITYCRITGVITVPWIVFSVDKFEIDFDPHGNNTLEFSLTNVSKYYLYISILTTKLNPNFTLHLCTEDAEALTNETSIKFELDRDTKVDFLVKFHPKGHGKFVATALLFLDKQMTIPYYNLTFVGKRQIPAFYADTNRIVLPPIYVGTEIIRIIRLKLEAETDMESFTCVSKEELNLKVSFIDHVIELLNEEKHTVVTVEIKILCQAPYTRNLTLNFNHVCGSVCDVEVSFCFTYCPITLHANTYVQIEDNPYPYFPQKCQSNLYEYMEACTSFLETWMFQQGFRRELYPVIPNTFHAISSTLTSQSGGVKVKGINVSYLNFMRRIASPLMKHIRKISVQGVDENFKNVKEIHDTYKEIINLLRSRGANLWVLQARFLLSYEQFVAYSENVTSKCNADIVLTQELLSDFNLYNRLNKQSWLDLILQSYKVFILDSCFFECVCVSSQSRDIVKIVIDWYNEQIASQQKNLIPGRKKPTKIITNITTDLSDGIAIASAILNNCPFLKEHFSFFCDVDEESQGGDIIHNACIIIDAMNQLRLYFPLCSKDLESPNFLQMLFLSIHLYVALPMLKPKDTVQFKPPLLRSSTRQVTISSTNQETLIFSYNILNAKRSNFTVEKSASNDNGKKIFLNVKYTAYFVEEEDCLLLIHGYNKTRIFDTYIVFELKGKVGVLNPLRKCKVTGPLYRPNKVDILVSSPFASTASFKIYITDDEPAIPVNFEPKSKDRFCVRRLNIIDDEIVLSGIPKENSQETQEHKLFLQLICLNTQAGNSWIWFRSDVGEFFIKVTTQPRWDLPLDMLQAKVQNWPLDPCSCGEACECYRTTVLTVPHRNELMTKALRHALLENATDNMMHVFDRLIETVTGKIVLGMLLAEGGTNITEVKHILRSETTYRVTSRTLKTRLEHLKLTIHSNFQSPLPITIPSNDKSERYSITLISDCGMDIRTYRILLIENQEGISY
ncbi:uncharacterized protein LOC110386039 isoform X1 [Bombyx mori]|uniref:Cilia- and flagella-associated protein 47 domain-containing protein n=1 Tax=Bombyx mori TaxID=7091 RepID=A0A8R2M917_BOMMO|nr:uncharacterized protein LOC110386039 [Bombyx mori]